MATSDDIDELEAQVANLVGEFLNMGKLEPLLLNPRALLDQARAGLQAAMRDREEVIRLANERVDRKKRDLAALEKRLERPKPAPHKPQVAEKPKGRPKK
jgi:hypothetical protein